MPIPEPVLSLLRIRVYQPLPVREAARRFGRAPGEFEAALAASGRLVSRYTVRRGRDAEVPLLTITPDGRQVLQGAGT